MALTLAYAPGATPPDPEELAGLIPSSVSSRGQLHELEAANIAEGLQWATARRRDVLARGYLEQLRRTVFERVWRWTWGEQAGSRSMAPQEIASCWRAAA
jgi:fido (protein-threonine AMPylation protein)